MLHSSITKHPRTVPKKKENQIPYGYWAAFSMRDQFCKKNKKIGVKITF